eukprot:6867170-Prymnesium_polylepis.1
MAPVPFRAWCCVFTVALLATIAVGGVGGYLYDRDAYLQAVHLTLSASYRHACRQRLAAARARCLAHAVPSCGLGAAPRQSVAAWPGLPDSSARLVLRVAGANALAARYRGALSRGGNASARLCV